MENRAHSEATFISRYTSRSPGSPIPSQVYDEIFAWLHPKVDPDMDQQSYQEVLACLAPVCKHFARFAIQESWRRLDFFGIVVEFSSRPTLFWIWYTCITQRLQIVERLRAGVKEFTVQHWNGIMSCPLALEHLADLFLTRFPRLLSTLNNLEIITLLNSPIPYSLLQAIGRLPALERMVITQCSVGDVRDHYPALPMFGIHEKPFPALRELTIDDPCYRIMDVVFEDVFCALVDGTTLRSLAVSGCHWMYLLFPHISSQLVSLSGNFSNILFADFLKFSKTHPALQHLTICSDVRSWFFDHLEVDMIPIRRFPLAPDDLPNLRSFSGPIHLAPEFLHGRPVTRLALGCHLPARNYAVPLTSLYGLTVFPYTHPAVYRWEDLYRNNHYCWDHLVDRGGDVQELFVRFDIAGQSPSLIPICFPNLIHLEVEPWSWSTHDFNFRGDIPHDYLLAFGEALRDLKFLKTLTLSDTDVNGPDRYRTLWLSPGDQHNFVHWLFKQNFPTLRTIVFSPWMVWHMRRPALGVVDFSCDLELLSTKNIRKELRRIAHYKEPFRAPVRDWKGKLVGAFRGEPFGLHEDVQEILKAMLVDTSLCA